MIRARADLPRAFDKDAFARAFRHSANLIGSEILIEFRKTIRTWNNRPQFKVVPHQDFDETRVDVYVEGKTPEGVNPKTPEDIYVILTVGTEKNYAVMTQPFQAKTIPNVVDSVAGVGGFSHLNMNEARAIAMAIEARNWDIVIAADKQSRLNPILDAALKTAVKASGHEYT